MPTNLMRDNAPPIPGLDKPPSRFALGTSGCGMDRRDEWWGQLDEYAAAGGCVIDTARGYGSSEEMIGGWIESRGNRDDIIIQTKCGLTDDCVLPDHTLGDVIETELNQTLRTLKTDYVDVYLLHRDNTMKPVSEIVELLNKVLDAGKVRTVGASNWEYRRLIEAEEYADKRGLRAFGVVSNNISLAVPSAAFLPFQVSTDRRYEDWHADTGIPLIPWSSQARGFFTGLYRPEMRDDPEIANTSPNSFVRRILRVYGTDDNFERLRRAEQLGEEKGGYTAVEIALAWLLHKPLPIIPIVGPKKVEELRSCLRALSVELTDAERDWLDLL